MTQKKCGYPSAQTCFYQSSWFYSCSLLTQVCSCCGRNGVRDLTKAMVEAIKQGLFPITTFSDCRALVVHTVHLPIIGRVRHAYSKHNFVLYCVLVPLNSLAHKLPSLCDATSQDDLMMPCFVNYFLLFKSNMLLARKNKQNVFCKYDYFIFIILNGYKILHNFFIILNGVKFSTT